MVASDFPRPAQWHRGHDHALCARTALAKAAGLCAARGARLTAIRRRVLELLWQGHRPVGAYRILEVLSAEHRGAAPPTVYRALEFLRAHGLVHRIASLNAYVGCIAPERVHGGQFLICRGCGSAAELDDARIRTAIADGAAGFQIEHTTLEVAGLCPDCRAAAGARAPEARGADHG